MLYFKFFPVIISPIISDLLILGLLIILLGILVIQPFQLKTTFELYCILPQYLLFAFIIRAIPVLRLPYQPLADPYYYFISTLNVTDYGTLQPILTWWYGLVQQQLTWPDLHLIGAFIMNITGNQSIEILRYVLPVMGVFFFLGVFLLTKEITNNINIALLAGLFASTSDSVLFYQSEYHPQGIAYLYFVFLFVLIIRYFSVPSLLNGSLMIVYALIYSISHHFSSILLGLMSIFFVLAFWIFQRYSSPYFKFNDSGKFDFFLHPWILIAILMITNHIFRYPEFLRVVSDAMRYQIKPTATLVSYGSTVPIQQTILNSTKYLLLALAIISIIYIYRSKNKKEFFSFVIFIGVFICGIIGTFIAFVPVDRLIGFYVPFAALFAALTLFRFRNIWFTGLGMKIKYLLILVVSIMILIAGPLNFFAPGLIFHDSPKNSYYWNSDDFSGYSTYGIPGYWINSYISKSSTFFASGSSNTDFNYMIPYFYGHLPENNIFSSDTYSGINTDYYIVNSEFDKNIEIHLFKKNILLKNQIYTSGIFQIGNSKTTI